MEKVSVKFKVLRLSLKEFWRKYKRNRGGVVGLAFVIFVAFIAIFGPSLAPFNPWTMSPDTFEPPSAKHLLGTDDMGRDLLSGILYGGRVTVLVGFTAAIISNIIGSLMGAFSGYYGGIIDHILMRATEVMICLPMQIITIVLCAMFGGSLRNIILVLSLFGWTATARTMRAEFLSLKEQDFVIALKVIGASSLHIIFSEILPNALHIVVVRTSLIISMAILMESTLSFLGIGDPGVYTWGYLLKNANLFVGYAWWMTFFPGLFIMITVLGFNLIGDGLNDALNPRLR